MTAPMFLAPRAALLGDEVVLGGTEGHHAAAVRRVRTGERVDLTDGAGLLLECIVTGVDGKEALRLTVVDRVEAPPPAPRVVVVQAIPKGDRGELAVEVLTEIGADVVVPWAASRCVATWKGERGERAHRRWVTTAREAAKQAHRAWHPEVAAPARTADVVAMLGAAELGIVLHEEASVPMSAVEVPASGDVVLVVGPEGGVTRDEVEAFEAAGACTRRLGPTVLRTSTAGVAAASILLSRTPRWA